MKPLNQYRLCPECIASLQSQLPATVAVAYCPHAELFAVWNAGDLTLRPCDSVQAAQRYEAEVTALVAHVQLAAERVRGGANTH